ncbi:hypothetical protein EDD37DRAFT_470168 [Exophiala viscosa]|uniref:uncharacterized protein n=1 Tax=Exophiala viscosa TaxID=2486360 RepID=UPI00219DD686|nr:hypothetical protein EDD37DRAFT_470168 [Exophiala viscosa]
MADQSSPKNDGSESTFKVQPPTAPRSMRRQITPPPLKRSDSYRPSEHQERRAQHDLYRPAPPRHSESNHSESRLVASDCYRPSAQYKNDYTRDDEKVKSVTRGGTIESKDRSTDNKPDPVPERQKTMDTSPPSGSFNQRPSFTARLASMFHVSERKLGEPAQDLSDAFKKYMISQQQRMTKDNRGTLPAVRDDAVGSNGCADVQFQERMKLGLADDMNLATSSQPPLSSIQPRFGGPQPPASPPLTLDYNEQEDAMCSAEVEKEDAIGAAGEGSYLKSHLDLPSRGPSRSSKDETASTTSTTTSRHKTTCRSCGAPGSQVTPLVPCSRCRRRYHDRCGIPKPQESNSLEEFVCGRCLQKEREPRSRNSPERNSEDRSIGVATTKPIPLNDYHDIATSAVDNVAASTNTAGAQTDLQCQSSIATNNHTVKERPPRHTLSTAQVQSCKTNSPFAANDTALQGTLYKDITCPRWRFDGCVFDEAHCEFAHRDTGRHAPSNVGPAKDFTCPKWLSGTCPKSEADCPLAHTNTLLHVGPDNRACRKHITCYFWKTNGFCRHDEEQCPYAHRDTGIVAWQPSKDGYTRSGKHSLKGYICPRWERKEECRWMGHSCPYAHVSSGTSCPSITKARITGQADLQGRVEETNAVRDTEQSKTTKGFPRGEGSPQDRVSDHLSVPFWAMRARPSEITILHAAVLAQHFARTHQHQQRKLFDQNTTPQAATPVKHMAKRSVFLIDPRKRRMQAAPGETPSTVALVTEQSLPHRDPEDSTLSNGGVAPPSPTNADVNQNATTRKVCESCQKSIIGTASRCHKCNEGRLKEQAASKTGIDAVDGQTPSRLSNLAQDIDPLRIVESDQSVVPYHSEIPDAVLQQALAGNKLKRSAPEEVLFVAKKKVKLSNMSMHEVALSLRQEKQKGELGADRLDVSSTLSRERRSSLEELTRRALINNTKPVPATQDVRQLKHSDQAASDALASHHGQELLSREKTCGTMTADGNKGEDRAQSANLMATNSATQAQAHQSRNAEVGGSNIGGIPLINIEKFTQAEHNAFVLQYEISRGDFDAIAQRLPGRTPQDCVEYYDNTKDLFDYSALLKFSKAIYEPECEAERFSSALKKASLIRKFQALWGSASKGVQSSQKSATTFSTERRRQSNDGGAGRTTTSTDAPDLLKSRERPSQSSKPSGTSASTARNFPVPPSASLGRACACSRGHKRCFHNKEGALDREKCSRFLEEQNYIFPGRQRMSIREWESITEAARGPAANDQRAVRFENGIRDHLPVSTGLEGQGAGAMQLLTSVDLPGAGPMDLDQPLDQPQDYLSVDDDPDDDIPLIQARGSCQQHGRRYQEPSLSTADAEDEHEDVVQLERLNSSDASKETKSPDTAPTSPSITHEKQNGMISPVQSNRALEEHDFDGPSRELTSTQQRRWTKADEQRAIRNFRERGVLFETESESDQGLDDEATYMTSEGQGRTFQRSQVLRNVYGIHPLHVGNYLDEDYVQPLSWPHQQQARPSKKQMIGKLLKHQCRERRRKFGNPHKETDRRVEDVKVQAVIQRDLRGGDPLAVPDLVTEKVTMSFREFIGMPEKPVIVQGKSRDELAYFEARSDRANAVGISRVRRVKDDDKFPFVYTRRL